MYNLVKSGVGLTHQLCSEITFVKDRIGTMKILEVPIYALVRQL